MEIWQSKFNIINLWMGVVLKNAVFWDLAHVALVRTQVSEDRVTSIMRVAIISELGALAVTSNLGMLRRYTLGTMLAVTSNRSMLQRNIM
jgi:hypothetical protein